MCMIGKVRVEKRRNKRSGVIEWGGVCEVGGVWCRFVGVIKIL